MIPQIVAAAGSGILGKLLSDAMQSGGEQAYQSALDEYLQGAAPQIVTSAYEEVDPSTRAAQIDALRQLGEVSEIGLTDQDRARIANIRRQMAAQERGQRDAIMQNARARGVSGSGLEYAQQIAAQQGGADRRAVAGFDTAAEANRRALQAMVQRGQMGGQIRAQDYDAASARDRINQFNEQNRIGYNRDRFGAKVGQADRMTDKGIRDAATYGNIFGGVSDIISGNIT